MEWIHQVSIAIHVSFGILAIVLGMVPLMTKKGGGAHKKYGRYFLTVYAVVILTATIGCLFYRTRPFLIVITMLSFYTGFSGLRALQNKSCGPRLIDFIVALLLMGLCVWFTSHIQSVHIAWDKSVIYATLGAVFVVTVYDVVRYVLPNPRFRRLWLYEHVYKIVSAYSALLSAFGGTILADYQPFSQMAPSVAGLAIIGYQWVKLGKTSSRSEKFHAVSD